MQHTSKPPTYLLDWKLQHKILHTKNLPIKVSSTPLSVAAHFSSVEAFLDVCHGRWPMWFFLSCLMYVLKEDMKMKFKRECQLLVFIWIQFGIWKPQLKNRPLYTSQKMLIPPGSLKFCLPSLPPCTALLCNLCAPGEVFLLPYQLGYDSYDFF